MRLASRISKIKICIFLGDNSPVQKQPNRAERGEGCGPPILTESGPPRPDGGGGLLEPDK